MRVFLLVLFGASIGANGQKKNIALVTEVLELHKRIEYVYGNVYFDTSFANYDTTKLKKIIPEQDLSGIISLFRSLKFEPVYFDSRLLPEGMERV